ncbi:LysE family translocator [Solihabitans fulvus]|uniref:LysE family translocator n=1 Tax=Solihabitans fulvus TaxID=1892852 RepID=UPI001CB761F4|nr:LysE family translocator [Solihabitans fulvus]
MASRARIRRCGDANLPDPGGQLHPCHATGGHGRRRDGLLVAAGTATGLCVHATLAAIGLSALVMQSAKAFTAVKLVGALYLVWLGITTFRAARRRPSAPTRLPWTGHGGYLQGFLGNVLNPKAAGVYLTLVPQFVDSGGSVAGQIAVLAVAHVAVAVSWLTVWTFVVAAARRTIGSGWFKTAMSRVTGAVLVALGARSAVSS